MIYAIYVAMAVLCYGWAAYNLGKRDYADHADLIVCVVFGVLFAILWPLTLAAVTVHLFGGTSDRS